MRYLDALLCAAAVIVAEWLFVGLASLDQLAGPFELRRTLLTLVPLGVLAAMPVAVGGALLAHGVAEPSARRGRLFVAVPLLLLAGAVAIGVSGGRTLAGARRPIFVAAVVALTLVAAMLGRRPLRAALARLPRRGWIVAAVAFGVILLEVINQKVLPRLYPAFHLGLAVLTLWLAALASEGWGRQTARRARLGAAGLLVMTGVLAAFWAPQKLRYYDNIRFVYLERAPVLSHVLQLAAWLAPPPPLEGPEVGPARRDGPRMIDMSGRDLLLVSIDALRADHVGAYGYERQTTPQLDRLAREGVTFEWAYTATPHTSYAVTSLMTGKYMRPLLMQDVGDDSVTLAAALRRYGYHTAGFFPPAVFFVDPEHFTTFEERSLDFEYKKIQFSSAEDRVGEVVEYLDGLAREQRAFVWVHLFEPHEPYEAHAAHPFGERAIDRYDAEIKAADAGLGAIVRAMRERRPRSVVVVTADHGEEFGDHGGRYHGTTVYEEQVRVPLVFHAPELLAPRRVEQPVSLVDIYPTILRGVGIPISPRVRGRDLGPLLAGKEEETDAEGFAFAETHDQTLLARGSSRLVCARRIGACRLYDVARDPAERQDVAAHHVEDFAAMKREVTGFVASMGQYEVSGTSNQLPRALRRGLAGDGDAAVDVAALLDDVDVEIRRKAAEVLFELREPAVAANLRRALHHDEDAEVRRWSALALTRLEQGAPLVFDLLDDEEPRWRRLAALALAEAGEDRGEDVLLSWWRSAYPKDEEDASERIPFQRAREIAAAFARIRSEDAVFPLGWALRDVRLRAHVAEALATIGEKSARPALAEALADERHHDARLALADALVKLGGRYELRTPLIRFLGVPDPLPAGLEIALRADMLPFVGGPRDRELRRLREFATSGVVIGLLVPESKHGSGEGLRVICRAKAGTPGGEIRFGLSERPMGDGNRRQRVPKQALRLEPSLSVGLPVPAGVSEVHAALPSAVSTRVEPGGHGDFIVYATQDVAVEACAVVPLARELPPPPPEPWQPAAVHD